jgi:hypothetical protein
MQANGLFVPGQRYVPVMLKAVGYIGSDNDFNAIANLLRNHDWPGDVHTVWITNGWHQGMEGRWINGQYVMAQVTYCDYRINDQNSATIHYYWN